MTVLERSVLGRRRMKLSSYLWLDKYSQFARRKFNVYMLIYCHRFCYAKGETPSTLRLPIPSELTILTEASTSSTFQHHRSPSLCLHLKHGLIRASYYVVEKYNLGNYLIHCLIIKNTDQLKTNRVLWVKITNRTDLSKTVFQVSMILVKLCANYHCNPFSGS